MTLWKTTFDSPVGPLHAYASEQGLRALLFTTEAAHDHGMPTDAIEQPEHPTLKRTAKQLDEYFAGTRQTFDLPLDPEGTDFQCQAWNALTKIPYGATRSYGEQAAIIGRPSAVRAIGAANGRNPIPIIVPCHRVIGADGSLTGFGGGLPIKKFLLNHEARVASATAP